jgi:uroporphyrinogen-III decarboxylase
LDFAFVPSWERWAAQAVEALLRAGVAALWVVPGVAWPAIEALGVEEGLRASLRTPSVLIEAMDAALDVAMRDARAGIGEGASGVVVADDMAGAGGPLLDVAFLEEFAFPRLAALAALTLGPGVPALLHCDGDARLLFAVAEAAGFAAVHGDHAGPGGTASALAAARAVGISLLGGVPTASLATPAAGSLAGAMAATLAAGGGLLVSDDGGVATREEAGALFAALGAAGRA